MKVIVDAMGGDNAPEAIVEGAVLAAQQSDIDVILVGKGEQILRIIEDLGFKDIPSKIEIVNATQIIEIEDDPANAFRTKSDSSMSVALNLLSEGRGDALISAGSTGALLSAATLIVKRVRGIRRAALAPFIPNTQGGFVLIDCGANSECTPEYLLQFAYMGTFYAQDIMKIKSPRVGLLNNGAEPTKGTPLQLATYELLDNAAKSKTLNFIGNVEAKEAMKGACDVLVCDGFTGNIFLKSLEGMASLIMSELKGIYMQSAKTKLSALLIRKNLSQLKEKLNPDAIGGTPLLGISKPVIKAHGSSNALAIKNAIIQANSAASAHIAAKLSEHIARMKSADD
ncbi:MAG: phosphate acyltransferase PlsX [Oscillospiraceae bacterium]|nr:phosphate acyltransferase PlsX [Oscillospiraceae bacterium]